MGPTGLGARGHCWEGQSLASAEEAPGLGPDLQPGPAWASELPRDSSRGGGPLGPEEPHSCRGLGAIVIAPQARLQPSSQWGGRLPRWAANVVCSKGGGNF